MKRKTFDQRVAEQKQRIFDRLQQPFRLLERDAVKEDRKRLIKRVK